MLKTTESLMFTQINKCQSSTANKIKCSTIKFEIQIVKNRKLC